MEKIFFEKQNSKVSRANGTIILINFLINISMTFLLYELEGHAPQDQFSILNFLKFTKLLNNLSLVFILIIYSIHYFYQQKLSLFIAIVNNVLIDIHILVISGILRTYFLFKGEYLISTDNPDNIFLIATI